MTQNLDYSEKNQILPKMIPKNPGVAKKIIPKNPGIAQKGTQKSGSNPQKSTQNNGTSPYCDICKLPPPPPSSFQDDRTESSTISRLAHCNAYWSTASHKSDKFLSQSTLYGSLYFGPFAIRSLNLEFGMIERSTVITWPYG